MMTYPEHEKLRRGSEGRQGGVVEEFREVTMGERLEMVGEEVTDEDQEFYETWRSFNRRIGFKQAVSVADHKEIDLMKTFWRAGLAYGRRDALVLETGA